MLQCNIYKVWGFGVLSQDPQFWGEGWTKHWPFFPSNFPFGLQQYEYLRIYGHFFVLLRIF